MTDEKVELVAIAIAQYVETRILAVTAIMGNPMSPTEWMENYQSADKKLREQLKEALKD